MLNISQLPASYAFDKKDVDLMNFIIEKSKNVDSSFSLIKLYKEYDTTGISRSQRSNEKQRFEQAFYRRIAKIRSKLHLVESLDIGTKVKILFALRSPIDNDFLIELRKDADVEVDHQKRIIEYKKKEGGLNLTGKHVVIGSTPYIIEKDKQMMNFLAEKCKTRDARMKAADFIKQFKKLTGCKLSINSLYVRYAVIKNNIYNSIKFDKPTRIKMLFFSRTTVHEDILKELRKDAIVEVDKRRRITKYTSNDGSLKLKRDHSKSAKIQAKLDGKRGQRLSSDTSVDEDESDGDDDKEKSEEENSDDEKKETKWTNEMKNNTITRSERMSKNRYLHADLSHDSDDDKFGRSLSVKNGKSAKNENSSGLKLQKRKIVDFFFKISESRSKIAKSGKDANVQNEKKSVQNSSKSHDDVIYDGPGEPSLPIPLKIKTEQEDNYENTHEQNEYKPDLSYLSNPQQNFQENIIDASDFQNSHVLVNKPLDKAVKIEESNAPGRICETPFVPVFSASRSDVLHNNINRNESSLINSKEFLKVLLNLVRTLNSPMFENLREKIEKAIEKLGEEDQKVPMNYILMSLDTSLYMVTKSASATPSQEDSTSLKEFLLLLRNSLFFLNSSAFDNIQKKLDDTIKELGDQDKKVSIEKIRSALNNTLGIVIP